MISETERIYKVQIDELIMKNYQVINQKNQEIAELDGVIKDYENELGKANDYINSTENSKVRRKEQSMIEK